MKNSKGFFPNLSKIDIPLVVAIISLTLIGLINLYSITHLPHVNLTHLFYQQLIWICLGGLIFVFITFLDFHFFIRIAYIIYTINILFLVFVHLFGNTYGGAKRWLDLGWFNFQPAEMNKIILILVLARILSTKRSWNVLNLSKLLQITILTLIPLVFVVLQPDLGTALITLIISASILIFAKVSKTILLSAFALTLFVTPLAWNFFLKDYQKNRVLNFISPERDPKGTGYNIIQSKIAIGSGTTFGKGFQKGTQAQLEFLPERHTDFIFSVLSEEYGFTGSVITIMLFLFLISRGFNVAFQSRSKSGVYLSVGMSFYLFWHMFINVGMTMGLLPVVGIPLPLLSYGGSSMLTTMTALGFISSVSYRKYLF